MSEMGFIPTSLHKLTVFILKELRRELGAIELAKFLYLIDVERTELLGSTLTGEIYTRQKKGPLPLNFYAIIEDMDGSEIDLFIKPRFPFPKHCHRLGDNIRFNISLSPEDTYIARRVINKLRDLNPKEIEILAYETEPMRRILAKEKETGMKHRGEQLDFSFIEQEPRLARWRQNKTQYEENPDLKYEAFLAEERKQAQEILNS